MSRKNILGNRMKNSVKAREEATIPTYTIGAKPKRHIPRPVLISVLVVLALFTTIYLPPMLNPEPDTSYHNSVDLSSIADPAAMQAAQNHLRNFPEADFDGDGLTNEEELSLGTGVYVVDNDFDGTSDYAEKYITETNARHADEAALKYVINADNQTGNKVNTPFKVHDIVMWADDYESKARGSVLPLADGSYNFCRFTGWVQFPNAKYAYKVVNGVQQALKTNENGYFYIDDNGLVNVRVYDEQPESCIALYLIGNCITLPDNIATRALNLILPKKGVGIITSKVALQNDFDETWEETATLNAKTTYHYEGYAEDRFGTDGAITLSTLSDIMRSIDDGQNVILSLMSHSVGENIVEVYGYTSRGNLVVCDPATGEEYGIINITPYGERILDKSGSISQYEHFSFSGCGYATSARHRMMIVDHVKAGGNITQKLETPTGDNETPLPSASPVIDDQPQVPTTD